MANYHPNDELLMAFAAGQAADALGLILACHVESCAVCAEKVRNFESLGGDILSDCGEVTVSEKLLDNTLARIELFEKNKVTAAPPKTAANEKQLNIPRPLRRFVKEDFEHLDWRGLSPSIKEVRLPIDDARYSTKLYKIKARSQLPEHTHKGNEYTLVMHGSFSDKNCEYHKGDFILADQSTKHQPQAAANADCICLAVMDAPLKMTGIFGRMLNPFLR